MYEPPESNASRIKRAFDVVEDAKQRLLRRERLMDICELAETNAAIRDQLEKLEELYLLVRDEND